MPGYHPKRIHQFSKAEIEAAYTQAKGHIPTAGFLLGDLGRGEVSRQLMYRWCRKLGLLGKEVVQPDGPRILLLDIETAPIEAAVWGLWQQNVGLNQIQRDWLILSFCAKWLGNSEVQYHDLRECSELDDSKLVEMLYNLLNEADMVIAQNGKRFDVPKIQTRFIVQGYLPPRPFKVIDTLLMARQSFAFTSNKLEHLTDVLCTTKKRKHSKFPGYDLWRECLRGNLEAWEEMRLYNIDDVVSMEELYLRLRPWYVGHPNVAIYRESEVPACPKCGSEELVHDGYHFTQAGKYEQMHCKSCGGWSRGRYTKNTLAQRKAQMGN